MAASKEVKSYEIVDFKGKKVDTVNLSEEFLNSELREHEVQLVVKTQLANQRQATAKTKTRAEVRGGGKKPWRQKGTGRARAGSSRSPIWVGGGTVFGPDGRQNYKLKVNKKVHANAWRGVLADKFKNNNVVIYKEGEKSTFKDTYPNSKTKDFVSFLKDVKAKEKVLVVVRDDFDKGLDWSLILPARNLKNVRITTDECCSVYDMLYADTLIIAENSFNRVFAQNPETK